MRFIKCILFVFIFVLLGCTEKVVSGDKLSKTTIQYIQGLGILDNDEQILYYYTSLNKRASGNFITKKRVASYWQNNSQKEDYVRSAFYNEIKSINVKYGDGFEFTSALIIEINSGNKFEVYFNDTKEKMDKLYAEVLKLWKK
jgi:hypothetical protein